MNISTKFAAGLPAAAPRWGGFPKYNFVGGHNDPEGVPADAFADIMAARLRETGKGLATYFMDGGPQGLADLRQVVADKVNRDRGMAIGAEDVLITSGSLQGMDLINTLFLDPGDTVLIEEFTYGGALGKAARCGAKVVGMPLDEDGIRMDALANILTDLKGKGVAPKYIYTIPTVQNPTGSVMPVERRQELLRLSAAFDTPIYEDECYADLVFGMDWPPSIYSMDPSRVVHIGSFSKTLAPALRLGYLIAEWPVLSQILALKGDAGTGAVEQMLVAEYFGRRFPEHVAELKPRLQAKLDALVEVVSAEFGTEAEMFVPKGGIFLWLRLPEVVDTSALFHAAAAEGVAINPGAEWAVDGDAAKQYLRLCFALPEPDLIREGVGKLAEICHREFGVPTHGRNIPR